MEYRVCSECQISKAITEMCKDKSRKGGVRNICKPCRRKISRRMREKYAVEDGRVLKEYERKPFANQSEEELLQHLRRFFEENGRAPTSIDLEGLEGYPHTRTYYRRFKDFLDGSRTRSWNDILLLAGITPLDMEKIWIAWEYFVSLACEKIYSECLFQPSDLIEGYRPDVVVINRNLVIDAATSNYDHRHKKHQFKKAVEAGFQVEYWCLYKTTENGINEKELTYVFSDEIIQILMEKGEQELADNIKNLIEKCTSYAEEIIIYRKQYIAKKLQEASNILEKTPKVKELEDLKGFPTIAQIKKVFNSYNEAIIYAGLTINRKSLPVYNEKIAIQDLVQLTQKLKKVPTYQEVDSAKLTYSTKVYKKYFGGIRKCLEQQGFDIEAMLLQEKQQKLNVQVEKIKHFYLQNRRMPNAKDYRFNKELPNHNWVLTYYGSMAELERVLLDSLKVKK